MDEAICRIGIISDSHAGIHHDGGWNQPVWIGGEETLFERLGKWRVANKVDFVIHCGDVAEPGSIGKGIELLAGLGCPVAAVRGNHDIMSPIQYGEWQRELSPHPQVQFGDSVFENELCDVVLLNNQWFDRRNTPQWHWETSPVGWLDDTQLNWLETVLAARTDRPAIVVVHYPLDMTPPYPIPKEFAKHNEEYSRKLNEIFDRHDRVKLVASGHFHCTTDRKTGERLHVTTAAFSEAPFQVRLIEISRTKLQVKTDQLYQTGDPVCPDPAKNHLNGYGQEYTLDVKP